MPTSRKRIGFLPSIEIKNIIDKICSDENLSLSKVTGLLVQEALEARKINNRSIENLIDSGKIKYNNYDLPYSKNNALLNSSIDSTFKEVKNNIHNIDETLEDEYNLYQEYLGFKRFKEMLKKANINSSK